MAKYYFAKNVLPFHQIRLKTRIFSPYFAKKTAKNTDFR